MEKLQRAVHTNPDDDLLIRLTSGCCHSLDQAEQLLIVINEQDYKAASLHSASIGTHLRHVIDRYRSFLAGLGSAKIDYDQRDRDRSIEVDVKAARAAVLHIRRCLNGLSSSELAQTQLTVMETVNPEDFSVQVQSSAYRELMSLATHSVHHLAIIAMLAKSLGYNLDSSFGKAPSTLIFEAVQPCD